jgi:hypothetical protein
LFGNFPEPDTIRYFAKLKNNMGSEMSFSSEREEILFSVVAFISGVSRIISLSPSFFSNTDLCSERAGAYSGN